MLDFHDQGKKTFAVLSELQLHYELRRNGYWACFCPKESVLSASQYYPYPGQVRFQWVRVRCRRAQHIPYPFETLAVHFKELM
jgi:hypothetical protein